MARTPEVRTTGQRPFIAVVAAVVLAAGVQVQLDQQDAAGTDASPGGGDVGQLTDQDAATVVGPPRGVPVAEYVADRQRAMAEAPADVSIAVVSFTELLQPVDLDRVLGGEVEVRLLLVDLPLSTAAPLTIAVAGDPAQAVRDRLTDDVGRFEEERAETQSLLEDGGLTDEAFIADYERRVEELSATIEAAGGGTELVYAAVVEGPLEALQALEGVGLVRLVDPAPPATDITVSRFHGLLPGDEDVTSLGRNP